ncbi:MAG TPA: HAD hydrolase-like protein [Longimicrobiales bacterium]|nr:HAD hydrolase-like protein [Longimicrobiales bacterium]
MRRLILFDIDGTLLSTNGAAKRAFHRALVSVYGTAGPIARHPFDGKTDPQIARELLRLAGLADPAVERGFSALWPTYLRELAGELARPEYVTLVYPGVRELLARLESMKDDVLVGLLTGNLEQGAALKLRSAGLGASFRFGAFGSDCERRDGLPAVAVERARSLAGREFAGADVVVIGDTPHDITCGQALGVRAIGVATGRHETDALMEAGAHAAVADLSNTDAVLELLL